MPLVQQAEKRMGLPEDRKTFMDHIWTVLRQVETLNSTTDRLVSIAKSN